MSDRERLAEVLRVHGIYGFNGTQVACRCSPRKWRYLLDWHTHVAAETLASDALAQMLAEARAGALREAADQVAGALVNEVGSGHTSTYSVRRWLRDRAALAAAEPDAGERDA